ncbi:hypothetical protein CALCODRAFT_266677 [Calocera cornea HHB12733]|uniref:RRM domain-containing protein n=1 Tax=Calocera cornea HHB12733 TaxID=1353952 RepID=A0A165GAT7_9BASI|nr:hypothetical protein CALCODRAFT_266677 [Calocera cornea HHB12733]
MASQTRTWGSRFEALTQESTPSSPDLHPCTTPSPVVSPPGLGPLSTSARDRTTTAPEHVKMGAHTNSMGDTDVHNHMRSTSYNIGGQYNNHAQHGPSSGHRVRHEASIFVAGLPGSIDDATMKRDLEDMLLAINNASESSSQPVDTVENSGKAAQLFKPIAVLDVHLVREARGGICAFIQVGSSDEASRVLDYAFLHPFAYHDTVLRLERARAYRSLTISMTVELLEKCIINIGRLHNGLRVAEIVSKDALGEASASVIPFPPDEVLSQKISVRMGDTDCMHKVATFFGPTESCQELSSDRFRGSNVVAKTWVIKWEYRNDCKAAFHTLAPLVGMNVVWTHLAGIHNFHAARQQALAERGPQVLHPSAIGLLDTAKLVKNPTALELNDANFPSLSPQKSYATPPKSLPGTPITLHETESEPTGVMTATPAAAAISPTAVPLFSPTTNPRVQLPRVNKVEKAEVQPATLMTQSSPASVINPGTAVVSALSHPEQDHSEKVDGNVYEGALQLDTAVTAEKKSEPVVAGDHEQSWQAFAPATEPAINVTQRLARPTGVVDPCSIFVGNLRQDMDWSERRLNLIFGRYGNIESIKYCVANCEPCRSPNLGWCVDFRQITVDLGLRSSDIPTRHLWNWPSERR